MAADREPSDDPPESDMLPDERAVIMERLDDLDELDEDEFLTVDELAEKLGIDRD